MLKYFEIIFRKGNISTGKNRLIFEVANRFIHNFLLQEKTLLKDDANQLKIIATEKTFTTAINIEGLDFPVKIHGNVDRIDQLNGITRIIDYKTGMVDTSQLTVPDFSRLTELKYHKAIQVLCYAFLYSKNTNLAINTSLEGGIYSFKNLNSGFLKMNFAPPRSTPNHNITPEKLDAFLDILTSVIKEIFNPEISFVTPTDLPY